MTPSVHQFPHYVLGLYYSDLKVLKSAAGWFIGRTCWVPDENTEDMGSRESGYYRSEEDAKKALESMSFEVRDCMENEAAYEAGLPRPRTKLSVLERR